MKLSIILPCYNVEKYITECLDSLYAQDIPETDYEVICVNDCSPDNSRNIILDYQQKHPNLILIDHETNKMLGAARNTGLRVAKGDYVWFIDSDDYIEKNVFAKLLYTLEVNELEILQFNLQRINDEKICFETEKFHTNLNIISGISFCENYLFDYWNLSAWNKIYKRKFLINNSFEYPEGIFYEDAVHSLKALFSANRFSFVTDVVYYYRMNSESIMNTGHNSGIKLADRLLLNIDSINFVDSQDINNEFKKKLIVAYIWAIKKYRKKILKLSFAEQCKFYSKIATFDFSILQKYSRLTDYALYVYPNLAQVILLFVSPALKVAYSLKTKLK